jgi:hypothetical protein
LKSGEISEVRQGGMGSVRNRLGSEHSAEVFGGAGGAGPRGVCATPCPVSRASSPTCHETRTAGQHHEDLGSRFRRE